MQTVKFVQPKVDKILKLSSFIDDDVLTPCHDSIQRCKDDAENENTVPIMNVCALFKYNENLSRSAFCAVAANATYTYSGVNVYGEHAAIPSAIRYPDVSFAAYAYTISNQNATKSEAVMMGNLRAGVENGESAELLGFVSDSLSDPFPITIDMESECEKAKEACDKECAALDLGVGDLEPCKARNPIITPLMPGNDINLIGSRIFCNPFVNQ